jgi:hypothetical protein
MSHAFIELDRRFGKYRTDETPENQAQRSYTDALLGREGGMAWDKLLQHRLVVILGEPGSGKTEELKAQQAQQSSNSFFLELDRLVDEDVTGILDEDENRRFAKWKSGNGEVILFLDAVDESKIKRSDDFFTALDRMKKAVGSALGRSRFVISSRIWQWRPETDLDAVLQRLGVDPVVRKSAKTGRSPTGLGSQQSTEAEGEEEKEKVPPIIVVTLLPLTPAQVEHYANAKGMQNPQEFIAALEQNNAWAFASRPFDVELLYAYWNEKGYLGNLTDLSEYMISKLLTEVPNRETQDVLTPAQAREGAEFLAAAVIFCRRLKFRVSDASDAAGENMLSPADALPETWGSRERHALMDRALFDAASHGAMSFHHRYHTEYLAAAWIALLMKSNCGVEALEDMLFATVNGQRIMRPSLKPVAVWLITEGAEPWRARLAEWILESCPEIHLMYGDPAALPLEYRRRVLSKLVERYQGRNRVHLSLDHRALARFANAGLADEINRYLLDKTIAEDLRADMLMVVRASRELHACIPTALEIFADPATSDNLRSYVVTVIRDIGDANHRKQLAQLWQALPEISNTLLARLCEALFPQAVGAEGLLALLRRSGEVRPHSIDLPYYLETLLRQELNASSAQELLGGILKLLEATPLLAEQGLSQQFYWISCLIPVCLQRLLAERNLSSEAQDLAISTIFVFEQVERHGDSYRSSSNRDNEPSIQQLLSANGGLRRKLFWERVAKYRRKNGKEPNKFELGGYGTVVALMPEDLNWLLADAGGNVPLADRRLALEIAANNLWSDQDHQSLWSSVWTLLHCAKGSSELVALCRQYTWNRLCAPFMGVWYRHFHHKLLKKYWWNNQLHRIKKFRQKIYDRWWLWRHLGDLRKGLYPSTLSYFAQLVGGDSSSQYSGSDWNKVTKEWGKAISSAAKQGCVVSWRQFSPPLPHEKQERNSVDHRMFVSLSGLQTLWRERELDFSALSADEVDLLVRDACNELNGFPEWFSSLLFARPDDAARTLEKAVEGEWNYPAEMEHVHDVVAKLAWMPDPAEMLARVVMSRLSLGDPLNHRMLEYALAVIIRSGGNIPDGFLDIAKARVAAYNTEQPQWFNWMNIWLQLDALSAIDYLETVLAESAEKADDLVIRLCASMYGRHDEQRQIRNPSYLKPKALLRLIPLIYRYVRVTDDIERVGQGVYSPSARDHAQDFRSRLLGILGDSKEPEAGMVLQALLEVQILSGSRDWILHLLDGRKYLLADDAPWEPSDIRVFAKQYRSEPRSDYQLFRLSVRLLRDIKNHVECSENAANRLWVRNGDKEEIFRGGLLEKLSEQSLDWFNVVQEKEVDLKQRPDLSVERAGLNSLPIEVKLANSWTVKKLLIGLENQLVGQYLRPTNIRHGIYVLGNTQPKRRWELSGAMINFAELVSHIQERASALQAQLREGVDRIEVVGIDFSDPRNS